MGSKNNCCVTIGMSWSAVRRRCRHIHQVVLEPPSWAELFHRAGGIPRGVRHALLLLPPPLNYPRVRSQMHCQDPTRWAEW